MTKKIIISLILCFSLIGVSIQSKAIAPVLVALGLIDAGGAITGSGLGLLAAGAMLTPTALEPLVGQRMGMFQFGRDNDADGILDQSLRIPLTPLTRDRPIANPNLAPTVSSIPTTTNSGLVCPQVESNTANCANYGACTYTISYSASESGPTTCTQTITYSNISEVPNQYGITESSFTRQVDKVSGCQTGYTFNNGSCQLNPETDPCPAGYTLQSGSCALTQPEVVPDKNCDLQISTSSSGATYITNNSDPDCATPPQNMRVQNGNLLFDAVDPQTNEPVNYAVTPPMSAGGGGYGGECPYQVCIPIPGLPGHFRISGLSNTSTGGGAVIIDVNGETGIVSQVASVPLNGQLIREGQVYTNAQGQLVNVQNGQLVLVNATGGTLVQAPTNAVAQPSINVSIPTDYARSGEASTAADKIVNKLDESQDNPDLLAPELVNPLVSYFNPLRAWSVPSQTGQCPTGSFTWNNNEYNFNVMCQLFNENLTLIQGAMSVFYTILALMIVLGA